ncbi:MAG: hypothetical protein HS114_02715 [Anaerolineales bacterium]|nr:hypothetical protein [Anaerolineales bacterium]
MQRWGLFKDQEFSGLYPWEQEFSPVAHCRDHIHYKESVINLLVWLMGGIGLLLLCVQFFISERTLILTAGVFTLLVFLGLLLLRDTLYRLMAVTPTNSWPIFPNYEVEITEQVAVDFVINEQIGLSSNGKTNPYLQRYPAEMDSGGKITVSLRLTPGDYERYQNSEKHKQQDFLKFSAGYWGLDNLNHIKFNRGATLLDNQGGVIGSSPESAHYSGRLHLLGQLPSSKFESLCRNTDILKIQWGYEISDKAGQFGSQVDKEFLFWIVPDLDVAGTELILSLCFSPEIKEKLVLENFTLGLPQAWQRQVMYTDGLLDKVNWQIHWTKRRLSSGLLEVNKLRVRLANPIKSGINLHGQYKISINNFLLSQLKAQKEGRFWYASGAPVQSRQERIGDLKLKTELTGQVNLKTGVFKLQQEYANECWGEELYLRPDHLAVTEIVEALWEKGVEIKSVVESPARMGEVHDEAQLWDRYWEINGRFYISDQLRHIEVHVIVYGRENQAKPTAQEYLRWRLYLRSDLPVDDEKFEKHLRILHDKLRQKVEQRLESIRPRQSKAA